MVPSCVLPSVAMMHRRRFFFENSALLFVGLVGDTDDVKYFVAC